MPLESDDKLKTRLEELRTEFQKGQETLGRLQAEETRVKESMLRISGAIQVLEEMIGPLANNEAQT